MDKMQDTVFLTQKQLDDLISNLDSTDSRVCAERTGDFRPVGRLEYTKRKYKPVPLNLTRHNIEVM